MSVIDPGPINRWLVTPIFFRDCEKFAPRGRSVRGERRSEEAKKKKTFANSIPIMMEIMEMMEMQSGHNICIESIRKVNLSLVL
jgi:hypothetical protein